MLWEGRSYDDLRRTFRWHIPPHFNIGVACADAQVPSDPALLDVAPNGNSRQFTFGDLAESSNRLANGLRSLGVEAGDRVAIVLPAQAETALAHLAVYKLGAVAVPISVLFGIDALAHRLADSDIKMALTDLDHLDLVQQAAPALDARHLIVVEGKGRAATTDFWSLINAASSISTRTVTKSDDPAVIIYTSGTTDNPKGAVHAHRALLGHQPGFRLSHNFFPQWRDRFWSPADWAWIGGLFNGLLLTLFHGKPMVCARRERFDPEWAAAFIARQHIRNTFLPPTALRMMRKAGVRLEPHTLRTVMSGGEALGADGYHWAREHLGVSINEIFGQTEANYVVGGCNAAWETRVGSIGLPYPGHDVQVLAGDGTLAPPGTPGEIAVRADDPVVFLGYWRQPDSTSRKVVDGWLMTGDLATADEEGYIWFQGRSDDVISSAGYRIGPEEIESSLLSHPAVAAAGVIGAPDDIRGERIKAFVVVRDSHVATARLASELQLHVRERLSAHEYPREVEFIDALPVTVTGKISRKRLRDLHNAVPEVTGTEAVPEVTGTEAVPEVTGTEAS